MTLFEAVLGLGKSSTTGRDRYGEKLVQVNKYHHGCNKFTLELIKVQSCRIAMCSKLMGFRKFGAVRVNPNQPGVFWRLSCPVGGGGGLLQAPLQISAADRAIATKICIKVECDINYKTVLLDYSLLLSFILYELIMLIYAKKNKILFSLFTLIKASRLLIFATYILLNFLNSNCALKNLSIEINFLCILLFYEFLNMYFFVFSTFCFYCFFTEILLQPLSQALSS